MDVTKDKRVKREIANSNERRRMQSINAGFQKLKRLLPVSDGEKISKANILQHAADFIQSIERDRLALYEQNTLMKGILNDLKSGKSANVNTVLERIDLTASPSIPAAKLASYNAASKNCKPTNSTNTVIERIDITMVPSIPAPKTGAAHNTASRNGKRQTSKSTANRNNNKDNGITNQVSRVEPEPVISIQNHDKHNSQPVGSVAEIVGDRIASPKNGLVASGLAKAAIALPLEVPYTTEIVVRHHQDSQPSDAAARKLLKTDPTLTTELDSQDQAPKGQNLDTICKAIMEIEGDRVFKNEVT